MKDHEECYDGEPCAPDCPALVDPNNCPDCGEFLYDPHAPDCPQGG